MLSTVIIRRKRKNKLMMINKSSQSLPSKIRKKMSLLLTYKKRELHNNSISLRKFNHLKMIRQEMMTRSKKLLRNQRLWFRKRSEKPVSVYRNK